MPSALTEKSLSELRGLLDRKEVSAREVAEAYLKNIKKRNVDLHAYLTVDPAWTLKQADHADQQLKTGKNISPMTGIPVAIKDVIVTKDVRTTAGSKFLANFIPPYDASVSLRLHDAGAVMLGKTNCDEFAMGSSNENSGFEPVHNPWDLSRVPGGSSGGSAAAVAGGIAPAALGTDTGGSIRQPAAFCGIAGLKPTYGRVSRYGLIAFASSLDQIGPMGRQVEDVATLFHAIAGHDPSDSTSANVPIEDPCPGLTKSIKGLRIGYPKEYLPSELAPEVRDNFFAALKTLEKLGARVEEISLPHTKYGIACYYILAPAEASSNLARFDGVRYTTQSKDAADLEALFFNSRTEFFGQEVRRRILLGTFVLSSGFYDAYYRKGQKVRTLIRRDFEKAFASVDVVASPTTPTPAFTLGSKTTSPLDMYLNDIFTVGVSLAGLPGLSVPSGFSEDLPLGLQLIGKPFDESTLLRAGHAYESETRFFERRPTR